MTTRDLNVIENPRIVFDGVGLIPSRTEFIFMDTSTTNIEPAIPSKIMIYFAEALMLFLASFVLLVFSSLALVPMDIFSSFLILIGSTLLLINSVFAYHVWKKPQRPCS